MSNKSTTGNAPGTRGLILLVEDNEHSASDYIRWLRDASYHVEHATSRESALALANGGDFQPDVVLLDLQIPSADGRADESVEQGLRALDRLLAHDPFRPVAVITAHSKDRAIMREVMQRTHGGPFVFKDDNDLERALLDAAAVALASPAYRMSKTVRQFRELVAQDLKEDEYRTFIAQHWQVLLGPDYRDCRSPYKIARGAEIDILAIRHDGFPDLWELKKPGDKLFDDYNQWKYHSRACSKAIGQLMEYCDEMGRESPSARNYDRRRGVDMANNRPRGFVVIGRHDGEQSRDRLRLENRFFAGLTILTYDDLAERAERFLQFLQTYRNGTH